MKHSIIIKTRRKTIVANPHNYKNEPMSYQTFCQRALTEQTIFSNTEAITLNKVDNIK